MKNSALFYRTAVATAMPLFLLCPAGAAIRLGVDTRFRAVAVKNADYDNSTTDKNNYFGQRTRTYLEGDLPKNIGVAFRLQSRGIWGRPFGESGVMAGSGIPFRNHSPELESAFIEFSEMLGLPVDFTVGRQPLQVGGGWILHDEELGLDALRLGGVFPWVPVRLEGFLIKGREASGAAAGTDADMDALGLQAEAKWRGFRFEPYYMVETESFADGTGSSFKNYIGGRIGGKIWKVFNADLEIIRHGGSRKDNAGKATGRYGGLSWVLETSLAGRVKRFGWMDVHFTWAVGDGNDGGKLGFSPALGRDSDGLERWGFGEYYKATLNSAFGTLDNGRFSVGNPDAPFTGIRTIGFGTWVEPHAGLQLGFDFWIFKADSGPIAAAKKDLGEELNFWAGYTFHKQARTRLSWAQFTPGAATVLTGGRANRILWEISASF